MIKGVGATTHIARNAACFGCDCCGVTCASSTSATIAHFLFAVATVRVKAEASDAAALRHGQGHLTHTIEEVDPPPVTSHPNTRVRGYLRRSTRASMSGISVTR